MADLATHIRIVDPNPTDDYVSKRQAAVEAISQKLAKRRNLSDILQLAEAIAGAANAKPTCLDPIFDEVEACIKDEATSFVRDGHELEMAVCLQASALHLLQSAKPSSGTLLVSDVLAAGIWSALSAQVSTGPAKVEALRAELLEVARALALASAEGARKRAQVPDFGLNAPDTIDAAGLTKALRPAKDPCTAALRGNASLDREELDVLWWSLSNWSEASNQRFSDMAPSISALSGGIELGLLLRKLPAIAHGHLALRFVANNTPPVPVGDLLAEAGASLQQIANRINPVHTSFPRVLPLLNAVSTGKAGLLEKQQRTVREWGMRALLESSLVHVMFDPPAV